MAERLTTDPAPPIVVRRRDGVAFIWHAGVEGERRRLRAEEAIQRGDLATLAQVYREAEFQHALALWMIGEGRGGTVQSPAPAPPPPPRRGLLARLWAALWG